LTYHHVARATFLQFHDKQFRLVPFDRQNINRPRVSRILLPNLLAILLEDIVFPAKIGLRPVLN
jgi:hypothetical protein